MPSYPINRISDKYLTDTANQLNQVKNWLIRDGNYEYTWDEAAYDDDPEEIEKDKSRLNRAEGYEMAPFILRLLKENKWDISEVNVLILEKAIQTSCKSHQGKKGLEACIIQLHSSGKLMLTP